MTPINHLIKKTKTIINHMFTDNPTFNPPNQSIDRERPRPNLSDFSTRESHTNVDSILHLAKITGIEMKLIKSNHQTVNPNQIARACTGEMNKAGKKRKRISTDRLRNPSIFFLFRRRVN